MWHYRYILIRQRVREPHFLSKRFTPEKETLNIQSIREWTSTRAGQDAVEKCLRQVSKPVHPIAVHDLLYSTNKPITEFLF